MIRDYDDRPVEDKAALRAKLAADVAAYTGTVQVIPAGVSAYEYEAISSRGERIRVRTQAAVEAKAREAEYRERERARKRRDYRAKRGRES